MEAAGMGMPAVAGSPRFHIYDRAGHGVRGRGKDRRGGCGEEQRAGRCRARHGAGRACPCLPPEGMDAFADAVAGLDLDTGAQ
ncbi:hypothetical protein EJB05_29277, partial [Eragrostis curvula]